MVNADSRNEYAVPRRYALKPIDIGYNSFTPPTSPFYAQAIFSTHPFWATKHDPEEQSAGGKFPRSGIPNQGLPKFIENEESLENKDIVIWYTLGLTHTTRSEEWPIMNVHHAGFYLVPYNFISQNSEMNLKGRCP